LLIAAAVCPHPPLLVPELAGAAAAELDDLRASCDEAVALLGAPRSAAGPPGARVHVSLDRVVVVGADDRTRRYAHDSVATLRRYGLDPPLTREAPGTDATDGACGEGGACGQDGNSGSSGSSDKELPLSLSIGSWLLDRVGRRRPLATDVQYQAVALDAAPRECLALGRELTASRERVALLVMGDGSAYRALRPQVFADEDDRLRRAGDSAGGQNDAAGLKRAAGFDSAVAAALDGADPDALARLDVTLPAALWAAGRPAWQVLAGAAGDTRFTGRLLADQAPYGVRYYVASWRRLGEEQSPDSRSA
jgi:hypothetical protein